MAEVKWIKLTVDMFDDEKIKIIQSMPEGDTLLVVWIKLITLAGKTNDGGYVYISEGMPYTDEMLSIIMNKPLNTIRLALDTFTKLGMIEADIKGIYLLNFEKHQSLDKLEKIKEQNRLRVAKYREKQKQLSCNVTPPLQVTQSNAIDIDKEEDIEIDKDKEINNKIPYEKIKDLFHEICVSFPKVIKLSDSRKKTIKARYIEYGHDIEIFKTLFTKAEESRFLKGNNDNNWNANFDWLINPKNMIKVLEGNYDNKELNNTTPNQQRRKEIVPEWINKKVEDKPLSPEAQAKMERLLEEFKK